MLMVIPYLVPLILIGLALPEQPADDYTKSYSAETVFALPKSHYLKKTPLETLPTLSKKILHLPGKERLFYSVNFSQ